MSQADIASLMGCSRKRVSEFELGLASPSFEFVERYAALLGARLDYKAADGDHLDFAGT